MRKKAFKTAFPYTLPILTGYWFLGFAYGIYMHVSGFSFVYPLFMSLTILGGSLEFVAVSMLMAPFAPLQTFIMALIIQARHLFYGISMLDRYKGFGWKKYYIIFGMSDETFSINVSAEIPEDVDKGWFMFWTTLLDHFYWFSGATLGGLIGTVIHFDTTGLDFVMTAMFVVILLEQLLKESRHYTATIGLLCTVICRLIFGAENFMIPTMLSIVLCLTLFQKPIMKAGEFQ